LWREGCIIKSSVTELIISAALGGVFTGVVAPTLGEWLRGFFNGFHANKRKAKHKRKILDILRYPDPETTSKGVMFRGISQKMFNGKRNDYVFELLMELHHEGRVIRLSIVVDSVEHEVWQYRHAELQRVIF
jgi:hypothetical protein